MNLTGLMFARDANSLSISQNAHLKQAHEFFIALNAVALTGVHVECPIPVWSGQKIALKLLKYSKKSLPSMKFVAEHPK